MKKKLLIIFITTCSLSANAQNFGAMADIGYSWLGGVQTSTNKERSGQLFYAVGLFYAPQFGASKWGLHTSLDVSKRGHAYENSSTSFSGNPNNGQGDYRLRESKTSIHNYAASLTVLPTFTLLDKLKLALGIHYNYNFKQKSMYNSRYYETDANWGNKELLSESESELFFGPNSFSARSNYGFKVIINYKVTPILDIGVVYQYARNFKYQGNEFNPSYHIINLTTNIYFKSRENANKD